METATATEENTTATKNLQAMFARKYAQAIANGATDEQAITALRALWLEAIGANK
jgi:hypothetical protein